MKVVIATLPNGFFGRAEYGWESLDLKIIVDDLKSKGISVVECSIDRILEIDLDEIDFVFYTSSDEPEIRQYIKDIMFFVRERCRIIPNYESLLAHENKGYQELYKKVNGFGDLKGDYYFDEDRNRIGLPYVLKTVDGAGSSGVQLVKSESDIATVKRLFNVGLKRQLIKLCKRILLKPELYSMYAYRYKGFKCVVSQEFIPDLECDYKVLIFGNRYFVLKRSVREGDFRASGSGLFCFDCVLPDGLLSYSKFIFESLNVPFVSLDVASSRESFHLIEYQAHHFGPYTLMKSPGFFEFDDGDFKYVEASSNLEKEILRSLYLFVGIL